MLAESSSAEPGHRPAPDHATDPQTWALLTALAESDDPARRREARAELIASQRPFAEFLARRFQHSGEPMDDLRQVAVIGLIKAVDGFDVSRGTSFSSYAVPTILGELRRHFRDLAWDVRVPRRLQELRAHIGSISEPLTHQLGRTPSTSDVAAALEIDEREVVEARLASQAYSAASLHAPMHAEDDGRTLADLMFDDEPGYGLVDDREALRDLLQRLPDRERRILGLRFYRQLTQSEIAAELGISQMHVSRLLSRSLSTLRGHLERAM